MEFKQIIDKAKQVRKLYSEFEIKQYGQEWTDAQIMEGFVGDVGDLMKIIMAKQGIRKMDNVDEKLSHELCDCLWCIMILADRYGINLEEEFMKNMTNLEKRIN